MITPSARRARKARRWRRAADERKARRAHIETRLRAAQYQLDQAMEVGRLTHEAERLLDIDPEASTAHAALALLKKQELDRKVRRYYA